MVCLGLVVAVSDYHSLASLPGCRADGEAIAAALKASARFSDIVLVNGSGSSREVKRKISAFVEKWKDDDVEEFVFYFTGHGDVLDDDLIMLLSDYHKLQARTTSLSNTEIDSFARSLGPKLFVKIIDSCHSGVAYIKGSDPVADTIRKSGESGLNNLYFMFSS